MPSNQPDNEAYCLASWGLDIKGGSSAGTRLEVISDLHRDRIIDWTYTGSTLWHYSQINQAFSLRAEVYFTAKNCITAQPFFINDSNMCGGSNSNLKLLATYQRANRGHYMQIL